MAKKKLKRNTENVSVPTQNRNDERVGRVAVSLAGRDKGRLFIIVNTLDEKTVFIADGKLRKSEAPKKKKMQHLKVVGLPGEDFLAEIRKGNINSAFIRKAIAAMAESNT